MICSTDLIDDLGLFLGSLGRLVIVARRPVAERNGQDRAVGIIGEVVVQESDCTRCQMLPFNPVRP